jgi:hypothetical protein
MQPQGFGLLHQPWRASASRDLLARRYLDERERAAMRQAGPRNQTAFLLERIAAKDCVRQHLWDAGQGPIFPIEIEIEQEAPGVLRARGPRSVDLRVAVAQHETGVAVARVAVGRAVDIAIERLDGEVRRGNTSAARTEVEVDGYLVGWTCQ